MVVRSSLSSSSSAPASPSPDAADPLRSFAPSSSGGHVSKSRHRDTEMEFSRLKRLVPTISRKQCVSKLDVILEAIRYIDQLQDQLIEQIHDRKISVAQASALIVDKENKIRPSQASGASLSSNTAASRPCQRRQRRRSE